MRDVAVKPAALDAGDELELSAPQLQRGRSWLPRIICVLAAGALVVTLLQRPQVDAEPEDDDFPSPAARARPRQGAKRAGGDDSASVAAQRIQPHPARMAVDDARSVAAPGALERAHLAPPQLSCRKSSSNSSSCSVTAA